MPKSHIGLLVKWLRRARREGWLGGILVFRGWACVRILCLRKDLQVSVSPLAHLGFLVVYPDVQQRGRRRDGV